MFGPGLDIHALPDGFVRIDLKGYIQDFNSRAEQLFGYAAREVIGRSLSLLISPEEDPALGDLHWVFPEAERIRKGEGFWARGLRKDGKVFDTEYTLGLLRNDEGVAGAVALFRDVSNLRAKARELDYLARHDSLTGLINRVEFSHRLGHALAEARSDGARHVLCYLDLDWFKEVNDSCGHAAGDELLRQLSREMQGCVRQGDVLARLGGDEFGLLLQCCDLEHAKRVVEQLIQGVGKFRFRWQRRHFRVGVSIGVVEISPNSCDVPTLLSAADTACYLAKDAGRNRMHLVLADNARSARHCGEMRWVARITEALEDDRLLLRYQPIIPAQVTGAPEHFFELLVSLKERDGTLIPPGAFIPAAERFGLMPRIDRWVVDRAFQFLGRNPGMVAGGIVCWINLSGQTLADAGFDDFVAEQLQAQGLSPRAIVFEVTESAAIANLQQTLRLIGRLKALGCRFALDDFGSGMSSFAYLKNLPVDFLKIDGGFVRDMADDPVDHAMVDAINKVGQVMNIKTVAEFVENESVLAQLRALKVDYVQGHYISWPHPLDELDAAPFERRN
ncbi:MAG: EAL domain-containing protein [Gammaproteobacteria bacterium]|nr:EAL domain-containing protein [Gammaproteobacteria bacterium]MBU1655746.1 EAL domain-containing protein [Gammaproteobacteria bacterium]